MRKKLFYGWVVVWAGFLISVAAIGARYCFGVFLKSLEGGFDMSRTAASGIFSVYMLLCVLTAIGGGWSLDRYGPRKISIIMSIFTGLSLMLTSLAASPWQLLITYSLMLALGTGATYGVVNTTTSRWFVKKRGFVVGITSSGGGVGAIVLSPLAAVLISGIGWRSAFFLIGLLILATMLGCALLLKKDPDEMGLKPDGETDGIGTGEIKESMIRVPVAPTGLMMSQCVRMNQFWLLISAWLALALSLHMIIIHIVAYAVDMGIPPVNASFVLSLMGLTNIAGRLVIGRLSDRVGRKPLGVACSALHFASMLWLMASDRLWMMYGFAVVFGILWGGLGTIVTSMIGDIFGTASLGRVMGFITSAWALGAAIGPAVGGYVFDVTGSYFIAFGIGAASMLVTTVSVAMIRPIDHAVSLN